MSRSNMIIPNTKIINNTGKYATVNNQGRIDVAQHAHPDQGNVLFSLDNLAATTRFIFIDISDTVNYPHSLTNYLHIEHFDLQIDTTDVAYILSLAFLENVDSDNGDEITFFRIAGAKKTGWC